jgi:hypothetical protein
VAERASSSTPATTHERARWKSRREKPYRILLNERSGLGTSQRCTRSWAGAQNRQFRQLDLVDACEGQLMRLLTTPFIPTPCAASDATETDGGSK